MSKAFRAKAKAEREIRGDHIVVERNTDPSLPARVFQRIYVCLRALKLGFRACRRDLLGLDGAFMKGPFPGQVFVAVGLDSNNRIYPLAYALVEAETKSSWCWFLQCLGDDIDLRPNLKYTFISDRQKGIVLAIKTVYLSAEHRYCLRNIHENMKQGWYGQAYKDLLWRAASATTVSNICEVFNGKIVRGRDKPVITLLEYIRGVIGMKENCECTRLTTPRNLGKSLLLVEYMEGNFRFTEYNICGDNLLGEVHMSNNTFATQHHVQDKGLERATTGGNNAKGSGSASRQAQQTEPAVGQDGSGGSSTGVVIGLSATAGEGGAGDPDGTGVASQGSSRTSRTGESTTDK
ncbi:chloroplast stem-loop binding protein of 41 kDa b, chloroplastic [Tanacetum coccineum]